MTIKDPARLRRARFGFWGGLGAAFLIALFTTYGPHGCSATNASRRMGLLHAVRAQPMVAQPFVWSATREGKGRKTQVRLSGSAPGATVQQNLRSRAHKLFPGGMLDESKVVEGAPPEGWGRAAAQALEALARGPASQVRLTGSKIFLIGSAGAAMAPLRADLARQVGPVYHVIVDADDSASALPELRGIKLAGAKPEECQSAFTKIMARNMITFEMNSAAIEPASTVLLDGLAQLARRCDGYSIEVEGHTDDSGAPEANMALSLARAAAVVTYLEEQGVSSSRLIAKGFGAEKPVAPNTTEIGRAQNRRIEFSVRS